MLFIHILNSVLNKCGAFSSSPDSGETKVPDFSDI